MWGQIVKKVAFKPLTKPQAHAFGHSVGLVVCCAALRCVLLWHGGHLS